MRRNELGMNGKGLSVPCVMCAGYCSVVYRYWAGEMECSVCNVCRILQCGVPVLGGRDGVFRV